MIYAVKIHGLDNVATIMNDCSAGREISWSVADGSGGTVIASEDIPRYHKVALCRISSGETVYKYGEKIGIATKDIEPGEWVHVHNIKSPSETGGNAE